MLNPKAAAPAGAEGMPATGQAPQRPPETLDQDSWEAVRMQIGSLAQHARSGAGKGQVTQAPIAPPDQHDQLRILKKKLTDLGVIDCQEVPTRADQSSIAAVPEPLRISAKAALTTSLAGSSARPVSGRDALGKSSPAEKTPGSRVADSAGEDLPPTASGLHTGREDEEKGHRKVDGSSDSTSEKAPDTPPAPEETTYFSNPGIDSLISTYREDLYWRALNKLTPLRFFGWILWISTIGLALYLPVFEKETTIRYWPKSQIFYDMLEGLKPPDMPGIDDLSYRYALSTQGPVIELRGTLTNTGKNELANPVVKIRALNNKGKETGVWLIDPEIKTLHPSMETPFIGRVPVPEGTKRIALRTLSGVGETLPEEGITSDVFALQPVSGGWKQNAPTFEGLKN